MTDLPRLFHLQRDHDVTGVSGTGRVADGVLWPDGTVSIRWTGPMPSTVFWRSLANALHVHGHGGATRIVWADEQPAAARAARRDRIAEAALAAVEAALGDTLVPAAREEALAGIVAVLPPPADRAADEAVLLPVWEAVYEPGNVSTYLIGYANDQDAATGMAEAWLRSQAEVTGRLEWLDEEQMATGRYDRWFELIERHDDNVDTGTGIVVRRRMADETPAEAEGDSLPAWLYRRFAVIHGAPDWEQLDDAARPYWEHQARAVRRAVALASACPGYETVPNRCACSCEGCKHHCAAHQPVAEARMADETATTGAERLEVEVDTLARLMCDADVHVNDGDYPGWDDLSKTPGLGQDEVRKAARYLMARLYITERTPAAAERQDGSQSSRPPA